MARSHLKELYFLVTFIPTGGSTRKDYKDCRVFPANSVSKRKLSLRREESQKEFNAKHSLLTPRVWHTIVPDDPEMYLVFHHFAVSPWNCLTEADKPQKEEWEGSPQELGNRMEKTCMPNPGQR